MWENRQKAIEILHTEFSDLENVLQEMMQLADECIDVFEAESAEDVYSRVCGLTLVKAKHLYIGCYSLILDGLGQETGALMRPLIEYGELLTYFSKDPKRATQAINGDLPKAGQRAKIIGGHFHEYRNHLNKHAAHASYSMHSLNHLLDKTDFSFRKEQPPLGPVLCRNLRDLGIFKFDLIYQSLLCIAVRDKARALTLSFKLEKIRQAFFPYLPKRNT